MAVYAYTFVCPKIKKTASLILPYDNTEMMNIFLEQVSNDFKEYCVIMQINQAGWHTFKNLKIPDTIAIVKQLP